MKILFDQPPTATYSGSIDRALTPGVYLVRDRISRITRAESPVLYRRGDRVTVINGQIVGLAGNQPQPQVYEV